MDRATRIGTTALAGGIAVMFLMSGLALAGTDTLSPPYATTSTIHQTPISGNVGSGFISWPVSPTASQTTGVAGYDVWARSSTSGIGGTHGSDATEAGFNITYTCTASCVGDVYVTFNWKVTWNASMDLTCQPLAGVGSVKNQFAAEGIVYNHSGYPVGPLVSVHIFWHSSSSIPTHLTGSGTSQTVTVTVAATGGFVLAGVYFLHGYLLSNVYTYCPSGTPAGYSNSELDVASGGAASATLTSVVIH